MPPKNQPSPEVFERSLRDDVSDLTMNDAGQTPKPAVTTITIIAAEE